MLEIECSLCGTLAKKSYSLTQGAEPFLKKVHKNSRRVAFITRL